VGSLAFCSTRIRPMPGLIGLGRDLILFASSRAAVFAASTVAKPPSRLEYILPKRNLTLKRSIIAEVRRIPSYKRLWQLVLYTPTGAEFTSARSGYASTREACGALSAQLNSKPKP
jgi:hypothetical protein